MFVEAKLVYDLLKSNNKDVSPNRTCLMTPSNHSDIS